MKLNGGRNNAKEEQGQEVKGVNIEVLESVPHLASVAAKSFVSFNVDQERNKCKEETKRLHKSITGQEDDGGLREKRHLSEPCSLHVIVMLAPGAFDRRFQAHFWSPHFDSGL